MGHSIQDIEKMTIDEVANYYNKVALNTVEALSTWQQIYFLKKQEESNKQLSKINKQMLMYTKAMTIMTIIVVVATIINLILVI